MARALVLTILLGLTTAQLRATEITGKVTSIDPNARQLDLAVTGLRGDKLSASIHKDARIVERVRGKDVPLPNGLKDIRVGDYVTLAPYGDSDATSVLRHKKKPKRP